MPRTGTNRVLVDGRDWRSGFISRGDVAHCMLRVLAEPDTFGQTVGIAN